MCFNELCGGMKTIETPTGKLLIFMLRRSDVYYGNSGSSRARENNRGMEYVHMTCVEMPAMTTDLFARLDLGDLEQLSFFRRGTKSGLEAKLTWAWYDWK